MIILPIKNKMAASKKQFFFFGFFVCLFVCFFVFCIELSLHLLSFKVRGLQMTIDFLLV